LIVVKTLSAKFLCALATAALMQAQAKPPETDATQIVFSTISGPIRNALIYAPTPWIRLDSMPHDFRARGVFKMDLDNGMPYALIATLRQWRVPPRIAYKLYVPVTISAGSAWLGCNQPL
jgi:hypothetical protein